MSISNICSHIGVDGWYRHVDATLVGILICTDIGSDVHVTGVVGFRTTGPVICGGLPSVMVPVVEDVLTLPAESVHLIYIV